MTNRNGRLYNLSHCRYRCQYHLVWTPKYRGKVMADTYIKQELRRMFKSICKWKGYVIRAWHIGDDHIHLYIDIPPSHSVSYAIGLINGKSSTWLKKRSRKFPMGSFWQRGYFVSTVGIDELVVRRYVENQQHHQISLPKLPLRY